MQLQQPFFFYYFVINWHLSITWTQRLCSWLHDFPCPATCFYSLQCCRRFLTTFYTNNVVYFLFLHDPTNSNWRFRSKLLQMSILQISSNFKAQCTHINTRSIYLCVSDSIVIWKLWPMLYSLCLLLYQYMNREIYSNKHELLWLLHIFLMADRQISPFQSTCACRSPCICPCVRVCAYVDALCNWFK